MKKEALVDEGKGKLLQFPATQQERSARLKMGKEKEKVSDSLRRTKMTDQEVSDILKTASSDFSPKLEKLFDMPKMLYQLDNEFGITSFSSEADRGVEKLALSLVQGVEQNSLPMDFSNYGIALLSQGSSTYCIFADRKRKVIVSEPISSMHSEGSWSDFEASMEKNLAMANNLIRKKGDFRFVINGFILKE